MAFSQHRSITGTSRFATRSSSRVCHALAVAATTIFALAFVTISVGCDSTDSTSAQVEQAGPLIVNSDGADITHVKPLPAGEKGPGEPTPLKDAKPVTPQIDETAVASAKKFGGATKSTKAASPQLARAVPPGRGDHYCTIGCSLHHDHDFKDAVRVDSVNCQAIVNRTALMDGKMYRVGDPIGIPDCKWIVASVEPGNVKLERAQTDRTITVTIPVVVSEGSPKLASARSAHRR